MKNNKGMTLVEIIISIALISIVLLFLFMLLVTVNDINDESEVNSSYLINKSLILKNIEDDLSKTEAIELKKCHISDDGFYTSYNIGDISGDENKVSQCLALRYKYPNDFDGVSKDAFGWEINADGSPKYAYVGVYYYKNKTSYVISYIHGNIKATRLLEDYAPYNIKNNTLEENFRININLGEGNKCNTCLYNKNNQNKNSCSLGCSSQDLTKKQFSTITIPIIGSDGKDYSIIISYYGTVTIG